ncbi:MAG: GPW/gp25 family protein [Devosia sp.]
MQGVDANTLQPLDGWAHVEQSIVDIVRTVIGTSVSPGDTETAIGTTVSIREYGSNASRLVDEPLNDETILDAIIWLHDALLLWEPRVEVDGVYPVDVSAGKLVLRISVLWLEEPTELRVIHIFF